MLYICFLSDCNSVGADICNSQDGSGSATDIYPFFAGQAQLERALLVLSSCSWDADDRAKLFDARIELTELAGFAEVAAAVVLASQQEGSAGGASQQQAGPDQHDSYEALVREAGIVRNFCICQLFFSNKSICVLYFN